MEKIKLSICIATYNRAKFIGETINSIIPQLESNIELVIVDGASSDATSEVIQTHLNGCANARFFKERINSGVDGDYDKAVQYAQGEYCWLMTDDDLLIPGAIEKVLSVLNEKVDLVVVNAEVRDSKLCQLLEFSLVKQDSDKKYSTKNKEDAFSELGHALSFIGCVVIKRECWLNRNRKIYYGSEFIHVGVILQEPSIDNILLVAKPLVQIRYGNAMWTSRGFEIWLFKWPNLIWSFKLPADVKGKITSREPWRSVKKLVFYRAIGAYSMGEYDRLVSPRSSGTLRVLAYAIAGMPGHVANMIVGAYYVWRRPNSIVGIFDVARSIYSTKLSRLALKRSAKYVL